MPQEREVVITGLGVVSPIGIGKDAFWASLCEQRSGVGFLQIFNGSEAGFKIAAELKDFDPKQYVKPRKSLKVMCREIQISYAAATLAMEDAGLEVGQCDPDRLGVVLGSELFYCDIKELEDVYRTCLAGGEFNYDAWGESAMSDIYPLWMLKHLPNMPACHIGIAYDARGPNNSIVSDESSSLSAVIEASRIVARGQADVMITGGTGSRISLATMVYRGNQDLSKRINDPSAASRPFEAARDGIVLGEGAGIFVIESRQHAEARGANILGRILGFGQTYQTGTNGKRVDAIGNSINVALRSAHLETGDIGHVNAHGRSTVIDDTIEALAIHNTLGDVPVTAPKSFFGDLGAGSGAVEMAASVLSFQHKVVPVTLNYERPDPNCPVNVVHDEPYQSDKQTAMVLTQSLRGQASAVCLGGP